MLSALDDRFAAVAGDVSAIAFDQQDKLHRVWRDAKTGHLFHAVRDRALNWGEASQVDSRFAGGEISLAIDPQGRPAVAYSDAARKDLLIARLANGVWTAKNVDVIGDVGDHPSLAFNQSGKPFITYHDDTNDDLKLAWTNRNGKWLTHRLDAAGDVGTFSSIAIDGSTGLIRAAYADATNKALKFAGQKADGTFTLQTVDASTVGGVRWVSLAVAASSDLLGISYFDVSKRDLKYAEFKDAWTTQRVATRSTQGEFSQLHFNKGTPSIVSFNRTLGTVNLAMPSRDAWNTRVIGWSSGQVVAAASRSGDLAFSMLSLNGRQILTPGDTTQAKPDPNDAAARLVDWKTIGGSTNNAANRRIGWNIKSDGWSGFVAKHVAPLIPLGMKRTLLHNPFGTLASDGVFQFDQFVDAKAAGLNWLTDGFAEAFRPVTAAGIEVIGYLGSLPYDDEFSSINNVDDYMARVKQSIQPLIDAGMSVAFDYIVSATSNDWAFQVVQSLRDSGVKVYAENRPPANAPYWHSHATIHVEDSFQQYDPARNASSWWAARNETLRGEILRFVGTPPSGTSWNTWQTRTAKKILADGDTALIAFLGLRDTGMTPQTFLDAARAAGPASLPIGGTSGFTPVLVPIPRAIDLIKE